MLLHPNPLPRAEEVAFAGKAVFTLPLVGREG